MNKKIDKKAVVSGFNRAAHSYDESAVLQQEVGRRLLERLQWIKIKPKTILDLGSGTGAATLELQKMYPDAQVYAVDIAEQMLILSRNKHHLQTQRESSFIQRIAEKISTKKSKKIHYICGDAENLPLINQHFDLVYSNLAIQWCESTQKLFNQLQRVLSPTGCLLFSSFGVDTLMELKQSWADDPLAAVDSTQIDEDSSHVNEFVVMHELGDVMLQSGLVDPVMDSDKIIMEYTELSLLFKDLKQIGAQNHLQNRSKGLTSKSKYKTMLKNYEQFKLSNGKYPATYDVVYGHAWGRNLKVGAQKGNTNMTINPHEQLISFVKK
ncbi:MAG: malonyl-ACP O-methyltransferase BioC [Pseudomonadota bacterium]